MKATMVRPRWSRFRLGRTGLIVLALVIAVCCYAATMTWYASTGLGQPRPLGAAQLAFDEPAATIDLTDVQPIGGQLVGMVTFHPGAANFYEARTDTFTDDVTVVVRTGTLPTRQSWPRGSAPTRFTATFNLTGDVTHWPFDRYSSGPIIVELFTTKEPAPRRLSTQVVDRLRGWRVAETAASAVGDGTPTAMDLTVHRSPATAAFASVIVALLVLFGALAVFVAVQVWRRRRQFQPSFMAWYAGMIFSTITLRNALPDAPPIGWWVDVAIVLWVVLALGVSMAVYVYCWWRQGDDG